MDILGTILLVLYVFVALVLVVLVLVQDEQGDTLGGIFGGGGNAVFSATSTNLIAKVTRLFGISFLLLSIGVAFVFTSKSTDTLSETQAQIAVENEATEWWLEEDNSTGSMDSDEVLPSLESGDE